VELVRAVWDVRQPRPDSGLVAPREADNALVQRNVGSICATDFRPTHSPLEKPVPHCSYETLRAGAAALFPLPNGLNITRDLIQVRKVVTGQHSQQQAQGLRAALVVLAGALQIRR